MSRFFSLIQVNPISMKHLHFVFIFLLLIGCSGDKQGLGQKERIQDFSSPTALFVDYVSSYTSGVVSTDSDISLRLAKPLSDSLIGEIFEGVFDISPALSGTARLTDNRTLTFSSEERMKSGQTYEVVANLDKLMKNLPNDRQEFRFGFQTLIQNFEVRTQGLKLYDQTNPSRLKIEGVIHTADIADEEKVQKMLTATLEGEDLGITWSASGNQNQYRFTVEDITKTAEGREVVLQVNGDPLAIDREERVRIEIPAIDDYKVLSTQVVDGASRYISVLFSDPLQPRQDLKGLVTVSGTSSNPRLVINLNELQIYPTDEVSESVTLTVHEAIKNLAGFPLKERYQTSLQFRQVKPEVRLVGQSDKSIIPNASGLILPFEAVGLSAVEIDVIRIFEDNVLQYLQVNALGGTSQLRRVGKPVSRQTLFLNGTGVTDLNSWNRFDLNLEEIVKTEPGAIYQIRIGFRKKHSLYFCPGFEGEEIEVLEDWGVEEEGSYWDSYQYYYGSGYNWEERNNPCSDSYYGSRRSVSKVVFSSDFGLIAKRRDGGQVHAFVTSLTDVKPQSGVDLTLYDYQQQIIASASSDDNGRALLVPEGDEPFVLVARKNDQVGYLKVDDASSLSLSNFNVSGRQIKNGIKGFVYGERGVWRPADTVHLGFILERGTDLPKDHPVIMELYNPSNQLVSRSVSSEPVGDIYRFDFTTTSDAPTGNWQAKAKVGGASFSKTVKIETIKPNRLKIDLEFDKDQFGFNDRYATGDLNVRWLTGATVSNLKAEYELKLVPVKTAFEAYPNYSFDDASKDFYSQRDVVYEGRLDNEGYARVSMDLGDVDEAPGALRANFYGKVYEEGGDFSISSASVDYYPYPYFVGLKLPEGDKRGMLLTDQNHEVQIATVDADGNPVSRRGLQVEFYKLDWRWWWDTSTDYISNYVGRSYHRPVSKSKVNTVNGTGKWTLRLNHPDWGRYYVRVVDPESGHSAGQVVYLDWPGWAGKGKRGDLDGAAMLDFGVEKDSYEVGDEIRLSLPSTQGNRILVSLETGSEVLQTFWVEAKEENTSIAFEATSNMAPNIYAHLTMVQPHAQTINDLPIRLYGVQSIKVVDPSTELKPVISMPEELRPEQEFEITISESSRKSMAYTVAIVDEGLLDITNFKTPDPWSSFYTREALGVKTWDVYDDVMGAFGNDMEHMLAIGGDGELDPADQDEANRFKPVVMFLGPFELDAGGRNQHKVRLPPYIGSVKTMVVAANQGAYGSAEQATPVKQPLMVLATLPRVAGPGEKMKLPVNVFALEDKLGNVTVEVQAQGALALTGPAKKQVAFGSAGDEVVYFDVSAKEMLGAGKVTVKATSGQMQASYNIEMNVIPRNPATTRLDGDIIEAGANWEVDYEPVGILGENAAYLELSTLPSLNIEQRLGYLIRYPHGCIEQTVSSVFAQLFLDKLIEIPTEKSQQIQENVEAAIKRVRSFQLEDGGFAYWPGGGYPSLWGTNYAGHFLLEAKRAGYAVPEDIISKWAKFQNQRARSWSSQQSDNNDDLIQAYRVYTLAMAGNAPMGVMNRMREKAQLSRASKWRLAAAYAEAGHKNQAQKLVEGLATEPDAETIHYRRTFGSSARDKAMILETLLSLDQEEAAFSIVRDLATEMGDQAKWMSTQTTAYCFIALAKYAALFDLEGETKVTVSIGGDEITVGGKAFIHQVPLPDPDKRVLIVSQNNGEVPLYARLIRTGIPMKGDELEESRNLNLSVRYETLDGQPLRVRRLTQGTNFQAVVSVVNPGIKGTYSELALTQIFPAGWEIINTRLDGSEEGNDLVEYLDIRDDRTMHYFDLKPNQKGEFRVLLNAAYQGSYYLPGIQCEAMYDNEIFASKAGKQVEVVPQ